MRLQPRGVLVAFEGIDGAGKTTQAELLEQWVHLMGFPLVRTKEPTNGPWGRKLRASAHTGRLPPAEELHAFLEDRREHVRDVILPALEAGAVVIVDRYYFSTAAYQGARGHDPDAILRENETFAPRPDLLVILEIPVDDAVKRIEHRGDHGNLFERREDLAKSAKIFADLKGSFIRRIPAGEPRQGIATLVVGALSELPQVQGAFHSAHGSGPVPVVTAADIALVEEVERIAADPTLSPAEKVAKVNMLRAKG